MTKMRALQELEMEMDILNQKIDSHHTMIANLEGESREWEDRIAFLKLKRRDIEKGKI